jgi:hypothetical protein
MDENLFKKRTKQLALRVIKVVDALPRNRSADVLARIIHSFSHWVKKVMVNVRSRRKGVNF